MSGLLVNGSVRSAGVTFYTKQGKTIVRSSHSEQPKRRTRAQFEVRQRMRHTSALWRSIKLAGEPMFQDGKSAYACFASMANRLPVVFVPCNEGMNGATLLVPGMPVSCGTMTSLTEWLGSVDGTPALQTDMHMSDLQRGDRLRLYTLRQEVVDDCPSLRITSRDLGRDELRETENGVAVCDSGFADNMCGWALVLVRDGRCSTQAAVSRCTYFERFTTEEALQEAAKSYGGLTDMK